MERASDEKPIRVHTEIKTAEEIQTGLVQGESGELSPFLINTAMAPQKRDAKEPSFFRYGIVFLQLENKERKCWVPKKRCRLSTRKRDAFSCFFLFPPFFREGCSS